MIQSYRGKDTKRLSEGKRTKLPPEILDRAALKLVDLNNASSLDHLRFPPSNHLEALSGDRDGQHSIRINAQWRICFRWADGHAHDVDGAKRRWRSKSPITTEPKKGHTP